MLDASVLGFGSLRGGEGRGENGDNCLFWGVEGGVFEWYSGNVGRRETLAAAAAAAASSRLHPSASSHGEGAA